MSKGENTFGWDGSITEVSGNWFCVCALESQKQYRRSVTLLVMAVTPCIGGGGDKVTNILQQLKKSCNTSDTDGGTQLCYLDRLILQRNGIICSVTLLIWLRPSQRHNDLQRRHKWTTVLEPEAPWQKGGYFMEGRSTMLQRRVSLCCLLLLWPFTIEHNNNHGLSCCEFPVVKAHTPLPFFHSTVSVSLSRSLCCTSSLAKMS